MKLLLIRDEGTLEFKHGWNRPCKPVILSLAIFPTAESWYHGILDTEILRVKDRFCRDFSGVWKKKSSVFNQGVMFDSKILLNLKFLITKCPFLANISKL